MTLLTKIDVVVNMGRQPLGVIDCGHFVSPHRYEPRLCNVGLQSIRTNLSHCVEKIPPCQLTLVPLWEIGNAQLHQHVLYGRKVCHWPALSHNMKNALHLNSLPFMLFCYTLEHLLDNRLSTLGKEDMLVLHTLIISEVEVLTSVHLSHIHQCLPPASMLIQGINFGNK